MVDNGASALLRGSSCNTNAVGVSTHHRQRTIGKTSNISSKKTCLHKLVFTSAVFQTQTKDRTEKTLREIATTIKKPELVARRREQIIAAALDLFRKKGYQRTTMREICDLSSVNRGSFYDYFQNKEDILVYIYKTMMYSGGNFDKAFRNVKITGWKDLEPYIRSVLQRAWNDNKRSIQLMYRETISLDKVTAREVARIESDYVKWVAENLRKGLGLKEVTPELEIFSNMMVFLHSFIPLRNWNMGHLGQNKIMDLVIEMLMMKLKKMKKSVAAESKRVKSP